MKCKKKQNTCQNKSRRKFLKTMAGAAASAFVLDSCAGPGSNQDDSSPPGPQTYPPRTRAANPYVTNDGKPILVCVQGTDFTGMLNAGLAALGGLTRLINNNRDVLIKPNLNHRDPYPGICSAASIADIVSEVANVTSGNVYVGDEGWESSMLIYNYLGLDSAVRDAGGTLLTFTNPLNVRRETWDSDKPDFRVFSEVYNAPIIINTCVIKRHVRATLTCALKCNVGTVSGSAATHTRNYLHTISENFKAELAEIAGLVNPELNIVDARSILTRSGPTIERGVVVDGVNRVIICGDIVATDVYCAGIMEEYDNGFHISAIQETLQRAEELGLGTTDLNQVEIIEINA